MIFFDFLAETRGKTCYNGPMQERLLQWYDENKRDLPWRRTRAPYAIWLSEVMLQQTRVETARGYWERFLSRFADVAALAAAQEQEVLKLWEGLGYYSRARNLLKCARMVCEHYGGRFPQTAAELRKLPGIGEYTAGAVASIAFDERVAAVDGNVERVLSRVLGIREELDIPSVRRRLREEATALVPPKRPGDFNQALMELGACVCLPAPQCGRCPLQALCDACAAGDAALLPRRAQKPAPRVERRAVAIVLCEGRALVCRREEGLLHGLWCFPCPQAEDPLPFLERLGIRARLVGPLGHARHVFTHRIWEMELWLLAAEDAACPPGYRFADARELGELPMPTAMRKAREAALAKMGCSRAG